MFDSEISNPNSIEISDINYSVIPFGHRCTSALACIFANVRHVSLPFDWTIPSLPKRIQSVLENDFEHFVPDVENGIFVNKYDIELAHFNPDVIEGIRSYNRRINAFTQIMEDSAKSKYFVYINEDFLYDPAYREPEFTDKTFKEMLELEEYLKQHYPGMNYAILYFDFKEHQIPQDSRIINIVLHTPQLYNTTELTPYEALRYYCGKVLTKIFNTVLTPPGYDFNTIFKN